MAKPSTAPTKYWEDIMMPVLLPTPTGYVISAANSNPIGMALAMLTATTPIKELETSLLTPVS